MAKIELLNMDCMDYMRECEDNAFDLAIVDPPYGINYSGKDRDDKHGWAKYDGHKWDHSIPTIEYFEVLQRISKNQIIWGGNYYTEHLKPSRCWVIWYKVPYEFTLSQAELGWCSFNERTRVFERMTNADRGFLGKQIHPTQKPVKLYDWLLRNYSEPGQKILDTHLGSGSSAIAAHYFGVDFVGIEIDEYYYNAAVERFNNETRQVGLFDETERANKPEGQEQTELLEAAE